MRRVEYVSWLCTYPLINVSRLMSGLWRFIVIIWGFLLVYTDVSNFVILKMELIGKSGSLEPLRIYFTVLISFLTLTAYLIRPSDFNLIFTYYNKRRFSDPTRQICVETGKNTGCFWNVRLGYLLLSGYGVFRRHLLLRASAWY